MDTLEQQKHELEKTGFLVLENVLTQEELRPYVSLYNDIVTGRVDAGQHRHDLGSHVQRYDQDKENICQIMWPSLYLDMSVEESVIHNKVVNLAKQLLGDDMEFDFDMLISKEGGSLVETPWHQDESYWLDLPDKRALSFWFPMEDAIIDNGCMWFIAGSHKEGLRNHRPVTEGHHVRMTDDVNPDLATPCPVQAGGCTIHTGRTLHYTGGNTTKKARRAYIINCRPGAMIEYERQNDYDHGKAGLDVIKSIKPK